MPTPRTARRERLLAAADTLFARWGFEKTSVEDIARHAHVSKGAVYLEFPTKEALFKAVVLHALSRYSSDWLRRFEEDPGEWSFARMFQHSIAAINANPLMQALVTRDQRIYGSFLQRDPDLLKIAISVRSEFFAQLQKIGAMRDDIPSAVLAYLMSVIGYGMIAGAEIIPREHRVPFEDAIRALGLLLDRGLSPTRARNKKAARALLASMIDKVQAALNADADGSGEE
jgi:AcrR family transcriptional regulator